MSHEAHSTSTQQSPSTSFNSALWFVIVIVVLFVSAVNFISVMGGTHEEKEATHTEAPQMHEGGNAHE